MTDMHEIDGYPGYFVSDSGRVYSTLSKRFLTPCMSNGYHQVALGGQRGKRIGIHVLVAVAYIGARPAGLVVNHKNGNRTDNRAENLEWVTPRENVLHAYRIGLRVIDRAHKDRCAALGVAKRKTSPNVEAQIVAGYSGKRGDLERLAKMHGVSRYVVSRVLQGVLS